MSDPIRIGIVEDEPNIRSMLSELFAAEPGFAVGKAYKNGEQALQGLPNDAPDVVLMDISMPGISGIECVRQLAPGMPDTQFLMFTMHEEDERVFQALRSGANGYLLKSSTPDEIINAVHELVQGGAPMSMQVARHVIVHFRETTASADLKEHGLSKRESELLELLAQGLLYKEIADRMGLGIGTVKQHIHRMYGKMHVQNRTEAVNRYFGR